jgi:hypothetical protein
MLMPSGPDRASRLWTLFLLALCLAVAVAYCTVGSRVAEITAPDGAYYYGVARHIVRTGRFEEPIVWHFIRPPDEIVHAPFDYWGCMTSLLLVPAMALFGATPATAFLTMTAISAASLVAFWYLVCIAQPLRHWASQALAIILFAFAPTMMEYRFQPESIAVAHLFILLALIACARRRYAAALLAGFCILLTRGDGLILFGLITLGVVLSGAANRPSRRWAYGAVGFGCIATYTLWSVVSFGTLAPPAPQTLPFLRNYWEIYEFGVSHERDWTMVRQRFQWSYLIDVAKLSLVCLRYLQFTPAQQWWFVLALLPGLSLLWRRPLAERLIWLACFVGLPSVVWLAGPGFYIGRAPHTFTPLVILSGALGLDMILAQLRRWVGRARRIWPRALLANGTLAAACIFVVARLPAPGVVPAASRPVFAKSLTRLDPILQGEPVASNVPWYVIAYTASPALSIPHNGEAAIASALRRYRIRWLVVFGSQWVRGESRDLLKSLRAGSTTTLGEFTLERVPVTGQPAVFRVSPVAGSFR